MSRFVDRLLATAQTVGQQHGVVTGEPAAPVHTTWGEVHEQAKLKAGALRGRGLGRHDAVAVPSRHLGLVPVAERRPEAVASVAAWSSTAMVTRDRRRCPFQ